MKRTQGMHENLTVPFAGKKVFWFGERYFVDALQNMGADVTYARPDGRPLDWQGVVRTAGFEPDLLVYGDRSLPVPLLGLEDYPCPTMFLCVDTHIHSWYPFYAQAFDLCTVSLRDHMETFCNKRLPDERLLWLPPFARDEDLPKPMDKEWDLLFVGNVGEDIFPVRTRMLHEIGKRMPGLVVRQGTYRDLYPKGRVILNIAERGDLNYRVFEVLGCGGCLLTPAIGHGQEELFENGRDLFTYPVNDVDALVETAQKLLAEPELCQRVAASGQAKVDAMHRASHRAAEFARWAESFDLNTLAAQRRRQAPVIHDMFLRLLYLHLAETCGNDVLAMAYMKAAKRG
ncbi:glycosyltransferase [Pseudodesulfovibrio senegalensis]|nr:glycosyltransferase [Pseudodesulfovibrio senegalensis]